MEDFQATKPIYMQLAERINHKIVRRELHAGEKLKSVREMAVESGVNPNTVQRTYSELERMNIVETRRGQGTFVTEDEGKLEQLRDQLKTEHITRFIQQMGEMGFSKNEMVKGLQEYIVKEGQ
ncbi:GntR family transcriptional regulator [Chengkuizengella axinellae]|uniref:GntR family transcriptional regulator n=1 Tax=Chengkuizengella axinellae TaxID=3064388 RepID=A0ABT9IX57_9BACL|nr:GntR family transcriptional regulator [Chengkuizengella sp. 2205SS18-9]MDP5273897.1 GntR family transcriptional regulator [Chengkuizengella sp. 2205SS18-9]